jgi:hypothetical protein
MLTIIAVNKEDQYQYCNAWYKKHTGTDIAKGLMPHVTSKDIRRGLLMKSPVVMAVAMIEDRVWAIMIYHTITRDVGCFIHEEFSDCDIKLSLQYFLEYYVSIKDPHLILFECKEYEEKRLLIESFLCKDRGGVIPTESICRDNHLFIMGVFNRVVGISYSPANEQVTPRGDQIIDVSVCTHCDNKEAHDLADSTLYYTVLSYLSIVNSIVTTERISEEFQNAWNAMETLAQEIARIGSDNCLAFTEAIETELTPQWHADVFIKGIDEYIRQKRIDQDKLVACLRNKAGNHHSKELTDLLIKRSKQVVYRVINHFGDNRTTNVVVPELLINNFANTWASLAISIVESNGKFGFILPGNMSEVMDHIHLQKAEPRCTNHSCLIGKVIRPGLIKNAPYDRRVLERAFVFSHSLLIR